MFRLVLMSCFLVVTACGGGTKLDGKNSDTLQKSVRTVTEDMSEIERKEFSQDLYVVWANERFDDLSGDSLFASRADSLYRFGFGQDGFSGMALSIGELVDGDSAGDVKRKADDIRKAYYETEIENLEARKTQAKNMISSAQSIIAANDTYFKQIDDLIAPYDKAHADVATNLKISSSRNWTDVRSYGRYPMYEFAGSVVITNTLNKMFPGENGNLCKVTLSIRDGRSNWRNILLNFDALKPGEKITVPFDQKGGGTIRTPFGQEHKTGGYRTCDNRFMNYNQANIMGSRAWQNSTWQRKTNEACQRAIGELTSLSGMMDVRASALGELIKAPTASPHTKREYKFEQNQIGNVLNTFKCRVVQ